MRFFVDEAVWKLVPKMTLGVVYISQAENQKSSGEIQKLICDESERQRILLHDVVLANEPEISLWHEIYKKFGSNPRKYLPSVEALLKRVQSGKMLPSINTIVDIYNYLSIKYHLPMGAEDVDAVVGDIRLIRAQGTEAGRYIGGKDSEVCEAGEVIYADDAGFMCRRWNWREADRTKITSETKRAVLVMELAPELSRKVLDDALHEACVLLQKYGNAQTIAYVLDAESGSITFNTALRGETVEQRFEQDVAPAIEPKPQESEEYRVRSQKIDILRNQGVEPWPSFRPVKNQAADVIAQFQDGAEIEYVIAGRLMALRRHGKAAFAVLQDPSGKIQLYLKEDAIGDAAFKRFVDYTDIGDIIWCRGKSFRTHAGEITLRVLEYELLSKCLHPLPEKFHGIVDREIKYRQRYLDLIVSDESRERFKNRSRMISAIRSFLEERGYLEVETPMLHPIAGGAAARPFITHHNTLSENFYLRIAPELYLKRLVVGGFERIYEINRNFRNEGISTRHNPEFTMLEMYTAYEDYRYAMNLVEELLRTVALVAQGSQQLTFGEYQLDFEKPFRRLTMREAVMEYGNFSEADIAPENIGTLCMKHGLRMAPGASGYGYQLAALFEHVAEKRLIQPTFICDFPVELSPLAKRNPNNPNFVPRFELFIAGMEISNAYNELNDPFEQAARFREQLDLHRAGDVEAHQYDADYVTALEYGLPPTVGIGIGMDRLAMLLTNTTSIKEVILFPTLKRVTKEQCNT